MDKKRIDKLLSTDKELLTQGIIKLDNGQYTLNSRYKIGSIIVKKDIAIFQTDTLQKIFIDIAQLNGAYTNDIVIVQMIFNPRSRTKAKIIKVLKRGDSSILCSVKDNKLFSVKDDIEITTNTNLKSFQIGDIVLLKNDVIVEEFGNIKDAKLDEIISLYLYKEEYRQKEYDTNINDEFKMTQRVDLTSLPFCTIDPASAKDHDDAIYFDDKNNILYVAIADVSAYIKEGSPLDIEARKRAFSIYLPNKVLPMIPFSLSANLCSLKPDVERFAYVFKISLDIDSLNVLNSEVFEATIKSHNKFSYEYIDTVLEKNDENFKQILNLYSMTKRLRKQRLKNGFDFRTQETRLHLDKNLELDNITIETSSSSHQLVEECMLLANCEAAKKLKGLGIFRIHDEPTDKKIQKLIEDVSILGLNVKTKSNVHKTIQNIQYKAQSLGIENEIDTLIIQSQQQARYGSKSLGHFGLGFSDYSHFTSPIRRYADLVLHRILKSNNVPKDIESLCEDISNKEREIAYLVWDLEDRKYARWAKANIKLECDATIVDIENKIAKTTTGARVVCDNFNEQTLFEKVTIEIKSSDIISKNIIAMIK